jgi:hypothetical protein
MKLLQLNFRGVELMNYQIVFESWSADGMARQKFEKTVYTSYEEAKYRLAFLKDKVHPDDFSLSIEETTEG